MYDKIVIFIINVYWYTMKIAIFIYMKFFVNTFNKIALVIQNIKKCIKQYQPNILIIHNSAITYDYCNTFNNRDIQFDYIVYKTIYDNKNCIFLTDNKENIIEIKNKSINLEPSNYEFIMVLIKSGNKSYDITNILKSIYNYYYINGAILFNKNFIQWICLYHLNIVLDNPEIIIMDKSVNEFLLSPSQSILLKKDSYEIIEK